MTAHPFQALPARTPAPPVLRCFVFQYLEGGRFKIVRAYLCGGVQKMKNGTPMLRGDHFFLCFPCSVALRFSTFATPLRRECEFLIDADAFSLAALMRCPLTLQFQFLCCALFEIIANHYASVFVYVLLVPMDVNNVL